MFEMLTQINLFGMGPDPALIALAAILALSINLASLRNPDIRRFDTYRNISISFLTIWLLLITAGGFTIVNTVLFSVTTIVIMLYFFMGRAE